MENPPVHEPQAAPPDVPSAAEAPLDSLLRGAALLLGCNSATLIIIDPERGDASVRVDVSTEQAPIVREIEGRLGASFVGLAFPVETLEGSTVLEAWRRREVLETASLQALVGLAFPAEVVGEIARWIGDRRYILVPVARGDQTYGIVLFERTTADPFSVQQREIMLRYAHRLGEILENEVRSLGSTMASASPVEPESASPVTRHLLRLALSEVSPTFTVGPDQRVTGCNDAMCRVLGYQARELAARDVASLFDTPSDIRAVLDPRFLLLAQGVHEEILSVRHRDGHAIRAAVKALVLADGQQQVVGTLVLLRPLRSGPDRADSASELAHLMRQERLATMGELAAQLAHQLRNPLLGIGATLSSLPDELDDRDEAVATLRALEAEVARLDRTLRDYLSLSARANATISAFDLGDLLRSALRVLFPNPQAQPPVDIADAPGACLLGDREGLRQALVNVLSNALDASPPGARVSCRIEADAEQVRVIVDDDGPGPGPGAARCFEPFYTTKAQGTGLGLTVARRILDAHRGQISLHARQPRGARVVIVLPARGGAG